MKKIAIILFILLFSQSVSGKENEEFRATWVVTWEWAMSSGSIEAQKARIREILDNHKKANMNAVLWQVRQSGTVYYPSSFEPWGYYLGHTYPGFDPIEYAVQEAHARGLEFHAWINTFEARSSVSGAPAEVHPEWICRDGHGNSMPSKYTLSPGLEQVRKYLVDVAMEIVNKYDIDGLHLDYVRWSEFTTSSIGKKIARAGQPKREFDGVISQAQIEELKKANSADRYLFDVEHPYSAGIPAGFTNWEDWWRWSVTEFVRTLQDSIKAVKPWVRLSPAALGKYNWSGWNGYNVVYQDAALWFNEGYIDQLMGMHYHWTSGADFYDMLTGGCPNCWGQYIQPGIAAGRLFSVGPGSYLLDEKNKWGNHPQIVAACRTVPWVDGFQFFSYDSWETRQYWQTAAETFFRYKTKIRASKLIDNSVPDAPAINLIKIDSLGYRIEVTPPAAIAGNRWFAIYRSEDEIPDVNTDPIIDLHFSNQAYSFVNQFNGLQDYNASYHYFATTLNRYWNESAPSNSITSAPIPSFAPTVITTSPAENDSAAVNTAIEIVFSKTMDTGTLQNGIAIYPPAVLGQINWSGDHKNVTVYFTGNLNFATQYTVTLTAVITDINGRNLDGNYDGIEGDSFTFHFFTKSRDVNGPKIFTSHPQENQQNFDIQDVLTVLFDERINRNTVQDTTIALTFDDSPVAAAFNVTNVGEKSVLNVQPVTPLSVNTEYSFRLNRSVTDTAGNSMAETQVIPFRTSPFSYTEEVLIDKFLSVSSWATPGYSGSTKGIYEANTTFKMSTGAYLPASPVRQRAAAELKYKWDENQSSFLLREYLKEGAPRAVTFDTTYTLQSYIFGDGSGNKFRFCIDEGMGSNWPNHEVSRWVAIDWFGWRLIEWKLSDPNSAGTWIGNGVLDGSRYRIDSFQLTHEPGAAVTGKIYFDNLRLVKKSSAPVFVDENHPAVPGQFVLRQNYPNPFNPGTNITFDLPAPGRVQLTVFDLLGRKIAELANGNLNAGHHEFYFDAAKLSSGVYIYRLSYADRVVSKRMMFLK